MILTRDYNHGDFEIHSYEPGQIKVNEEIIYDSIIISAHQLLRWKPQSIEEITIDAFDIIIELAPEILLLGTGTSLVFPNMGLLENIIKAQIGFEIMSTPAACRTFNVLMSENRNVVAALLLR